MIFFKNLYTRSFKFCYFLYTVIGILLPKFKHSKKRRGKEKKNDGKKSQRKKKEEEKKKDDKKIKRSKYFGSSIVILIVANKLRLHSLPCFSVCVYLNHKSV